MNASCPPPRRDAPEPAPLPVAARDLARLSRSAAPAVAPTEPAPPTVLFCGGFHSTMRGTKAAHLDELCTRRGLGFERFDYRGHGETPGDAAALGIGHWLADTLAVIDDIDGSILTVGSSMGAWLAVLAAFERPHRVAAVLTLAAAPDFTERRLRGSLNEHERSHADARRIAYRHSEWSEHPWPLPPVLFDSGRQHAILQDGPRRPLGVPLHLLHGNRDMDVPDASSRALLDVIGAPGDELQILAEADHRLSDEISLRAMEHALDRLLDRVRDRLPDADAISR